MGIIKTVHLIYEYIRHDEEEKVAEVKRAIDGVDLKSKKAHLQPFWVIMAQENPLWQSISTVFCCLQRELYG